MKTVNVEGIDLVVADAGMGTPVLLVHGFPLNMQMWDAQADALEAEHRVIAVDLRGFGQSEVVESVTMQRFADDLAVVLDSLGVDEPVAFCGLSMGGYIAWEFWRRHQGRVAKLILCDTRAAGDTPEAVEGRHELVERIRVEGTSFVPDLMLPKLLSPETQRERPHVTEAVAHMIATTHPAGVVAAALGMAQRADSTALLPTIDAPALLLVGEHDAITSVEEMKQMAAAMPDARLIVIPQAGHMAPMENPAAVNEAILEFLSE